MEGAVEPDAEGRLDTVVAGLREQFLDRGFLVLRSCVRPAELQPLRASVEALGEAHAARQSLDPSEVASWRINIPGVVTEETMNAVEFVLGHNTLGVSHVLMGGSPPHSSSQSGGSSSWETVAAATLEDPAVKTALGGEVSVLSSGGAHHGATDWHR